MSVKSLGRGLGLVVLVVLLAGNLVVGARMQAQLSASEEPDSAFEKMALFTRVLEQVREHYVEQDKTTYKDLMYGAMRGMLESLDPHSQFLDPDMYNDMKDDTAGEFGGLGIVIGIKDNVLTVVSPMEDTPGFKAGLLSGDKIIEIDGITTDGMSLQEAVKKLRGTPGTKVSLKVLRPKNQDIRDIDLVRAVINVPSVKDVKMLDDSIGYIRVIQFNEPTAEALRNGVEKLRKQGMQGLVLDLRNNPGGLLTAAIEVSEKFIKRGEMIVYTQGRNEKPQQTFRAKGRHHYLDFPMAILVNGGSASASEIVAGALQDHQRAILVGERTFGKGSVQSVLPLDDGSAIRLTTAKYYTPSKRVIHENGIEPDIVVPMSSEEWRRLLQKRAIEEGADIDSAEDVSNAIDVQLERAVDVLKGVMIFSAVDSGEKLAGRAQ